MGDFSLNVVRCILGTGGMFAREGRQDSFGRTQLVCIVREWACLLPDLNNLCRE